MSEKKTCMNCEYKENECGVTIRNRYHYKRDYIAFLKESSEDCKDYKLKEA